MLFNIRELIAAFDSDAFELYCRYNYLSPNYIKRLIKVEFIEFDNNNKEFENDEENKVNKKFKNDKESEDNKEFEYNKKSKYDEELKYNKESENNLDSD